MTLCQARAGVETTMSGTLASRARCRLSETFSVSLAAWMSFAQNAVNCSIALKTWSASSRVGTRMRAAV